MDKEEHEAKRIIAKRLRCSDRKKWDDLSESERSAVVNKIYDLAGIQNVGLLRVLEDNRNIGRNFGVLGLGLLLGILGSAVASILLKYTPSALWFDALVLAGFVIFLFWFIRDVEKILAKNWASDDVLGHVLELVKKDEQKDSVSEIKSSLLSQ